MESDEERQDEGATLEPARFADRTVAFFIDLSLFVAGLYASLFAIILSRGIPSHPRFPGLWTLLWAALFLAYHAHFSAQGRRTLGKRLMGIRVTGLDGGTLGFGRAFARSFGYILSGTVFGLGFLWALPHRRGAAWHDLLAGTQVVEETPKGSLARAASTAAAFVIAALVAAGWAWTYLGAPHFAQMQLVASAETGLEALAKLQERHHQETGLYASDLDSLARIYGDKEALTQALSQILDVETLRVEGGRTAFSLEARATDRNKTLVRRAGPGGGS